MQICRNPSFFGGRRGRLAKGKCFSQAKGVFRQPFGGLDSWLAICTIVQSKWGNHPGSKPQDLRHASPHHEVDGLCHGRCQPHGGSGLDLDLLRHRLPLHVHHAASLVGDAFGKVRACWSSDASGSYVVWFCFPSCAQ